jgi:type VI secretion system secreted protein VgrG
MATQSLIYQLTLGGHTLDVREVKGREAISEPFRFELALTVPEGVELDPEQMVKSEAALLLVRDSATRRIDGVVSELFVTRSLSGQPDLELVLEPRFALSVFRSNVKAYLHKKVPDIVSEVLAELGVSFELRLGASYDVRPYTVQCRETDFHFVSRLLEEEGIFYFFAEGGVMVIGDGPAAYDAVGVVPFLQPSGMDRNDEAVWALGEHASASVAKVSLRDWSADAPSMPMDVQAAGPTPAGPEFYDYPGEYDEPAAGQRIATLTAESFACASAGVVGKSRVAAFAAGRTFTVQDAPEGAPRGEFALTSVNHEFHRERGGFSVDFEALDAATSYRPPRVHTEPLLPNPFTGIVTGPPGADIHTDELGRVKVHFMWDRLQPLDDTCSHWIPVLQDNTGHSVGIPRIGWEVLVGFMEGDPDRPVVLGRLYNAEDTFPVELPGWKTRTKLKSLSSPGRDGTNEIELEDLAGREHIRVFAEKDQNVVIANDKTERILVNELRSVANDESIDIGVNNTITANSQATLTVQGEQTVTIGGDSKRMTARNETEKIDGNNTLTIGGMHMRRVGSSDSVQATTLNEQVGGAILEASLKSNSVGGSIGMSTVVGGAIIELAKEAKSEAASKARAETVGGVVFTKAKEDVKIEAGKIRATTVGGALKVDAKKDMVLVGTEKISIESLTQEHVAVDDVTLKVGDSVVTMKEDLIKVVSGTISITIESNSNMGSEESYQN